MILLVRLTFLASELSGFKKFPVISNIKISSSSSSRSSRSSSSSSSSSSSNNNNNNNNSISNSSINIKMVD
jgi:hypothetical protein